jgi:type IV secretory pathway VirB6-like protein
MLHYFTWHYTTAYRDYLRAWLNYLWFVAHFFSLGILLRTFFAPFKRISEKNEKGLNVQAFFEALAVNTLMRLVGMLVRTALISIGLIALVFIAIAGAVGLLIWTLMPVVLLGLLLVTIFGWDQLLAL